MKRQAKRGQSFKRLVRVVGETYYKRLPAAATCNDWLLITRHRTDLKDPKSATKTYTITHRGTGMAVIQCIPNIRLAQLLAGAISEMFDWKKITGKNAVGALHPHTPSGLYIWFMSWVNEGNKLHRSFRLVEDIE